MSFPPAVSTRSPSGLNSASLTLSLWPRMTTRSRDTASAPWRASRERGVSRSPMARLASRRLSSGEAASSANDLLPSSFACAVSRS